MADPATTRRRYEQACPVAHTLDLVGERWTLLIIRDLFFTGRRFSDLRDGLPGLAPNLLATRLRFLESAGIVERHADAGASSPRRYELTARGRDLGPVVNELARFGVPLWTAPDETPDHLGQGALLALMKPERLDRTGWSAVLVIGTASFAVTVDPARELPGERALERVRVRRHEGAIGGPTAVVEADLSTLRDLWLDRVTLADADATGRLSRRGRDRTLERLGVLMGWT